MPETPAVAVEAAPTQPGNASVAQRPASPGQQERSPTGLAPDASVEQPLPQEQEEARAQLLQQRAQTLATQGLESARQSALAECWPEGVPSGAGSLVDFTYNIVIDEKGDEVARGYNTETDGGTQELLDCLRDHAGPRLHMSPPPGHRVVVDVDVSYP